MLAGLMLFLALGVSGGDMPGYHECRHLNPLQIREHAVKCNNGFKTRECIVTTGLAWDRRCAVMCIGVETFYSEVPLELGRVEFQSRSLGRWWCQIDR